MESRIWQIYPQVDVVPIAVGIGMTPAHWYYSFDPASYHYPLLCDESEAVYSAYRFSPFVPVNYVIDADGIVRYRASYYAMGEIVAVVEALYNPPDYTIEVDGAYAGGTLDLDYTIGTAGTATWSNYLVLTSPSVQVVPLWSVQVPALDPPMEIPISFPFPSMGWIGIYSTLLVGGDVQASDLDWIDTGK